MAYQEKMDNTENMQGMEGGENMHEIAEAGRGTDTVMGHLSLGEVVIPRAFLDDPQVLQAIQAIFSAAGADLAEFTVGGKANKINPETGCPEFGFFGDIVDTVSDVFSGAADVVENVVSPVVRPVTDAFKQISSIPGANFAIPIAASLLAPGIGTALSSGLGLGLGGVGATALGSGALGTGLSLLGGNNIGNALTSGALSGALSYGAGALGSATGGLGDTALGRAVDGAYQGSALQSLYNGAGEALNGAYQGSIIQDLYTGANGVLDSVSSGVNDLYQGSSLQDAYRSGSDFLSENLGLGTGGSTTSLAPASVGSGASSYGGRDFLSENLGLGTGDYGQYSVGGAADRLFDVPPSAIALNGASSGVAPVASNYSYLAPLLSAGLGYNANSNSADALRRQQEANLRVLRNSRTEAENYLTQQQQANQALLNQYNQPFDFNPGDLTQDPGYQFNLAEGNRAADRANLARGNYFSGEALREAQQFGQGLADNTYNAAFNRALQGRNAGLQGALAQVGTNSNYGQNLANQAINYGNSVTGVNTDIGNIDANRSVYNSNLLSGALGSLLGGDSFTNSGALSSAMYSPKLAEFLRRNRQGGASYAR